MFESKKTRTIVGVVEFSNILGINQIRFSKGHINETFGDVISFIKREFEEDDSFSRVTRPRLT